jgi:hypothetical protein
MHVVRGDNKLKTKAMHAPVTLNLEPIPEGLNLDNRNFESVTDFHSVCYVYGRFGGRNRLFRAQVRYYMQSFS